MYYIGIMSGTSADGVDAALVQFKANQIKLVSQVSLDFPPSIQKAITSLYTPSGNEIDRLGTLTHVISQYYIDAVKKALDQSALQPSDITALGCHGQTVRHRPDTQIAAHPFTLQLLDPSFIACKTGITTVCDFRRKDMALGGEGAPIVPAFHHAVFASAQNMRCIVNIGGIANITLLNNNTAGFDTGPGNALIDAWMQKAFERPFDPQGEYAKKGQIDSALLNTLLAHPYFKQAPPKSTGREEFTLDWLHTHIDASSHSNINIIATLTELTAQSIAQAIQQQIQSQSPKCDIYICGGGARNKTLCTRLAKLLGDNFNISSTSDLGVDPQHVEAMAFAWLAKQTINQLPGNEPNATGASRKAILGGIYLP